MNELRPHEMFLWHRLYRILPSQAIVHCTENQNFPTKNCKNFHVKIEIPQRKNNDCIFRSLLICDLTYNTDLYCIFVLLNTNILGISKNFGEDKLMWWARRHHCHKIIKTNLKTLVSPLLTRPQGSQGCQKIRQDPLNMPVEVWCTKIAPKLKNI